MRSTVSPDPFPPTTAIPDPLAYPVPAVAIVPSVCTPPPLGLVIVIVSSTAYPVPAAFTATPVT